MSTIDTKSINTIRALSADMIEKAKSGHPGTPLGAAPTAYALWDRLLHTTPIDSKWVNRDRFILSAGHASALLYSLLHIYGYDVTDATLLYVTGTIVDHGETRGKFSSTAYYLGQSENSAQTDTIEK